MIVDCALYREGERVEDVRSLPRMAAAAKDDADSFVWMGLANPTHTDLVGVARLFGIHPLAIEDAENDHHRPKLDVYPGYLALALRTVRWDPATEGIDTGQLMVFVGPDFVVTVRHGDGGTLEGVRSHLEQTKAMGEHGAGAVLHAVCDAVVDQYTAVAAEVEDSVEALEALVFAADRFDDSARIYRLKREVHEFRRAVIPLAEPLAILKERASLPLSPGIRPFFADVRDHVLRVGELVEAYDRQLADIVQAHLAQVGVRQNNDMRKISAYVALAAVPTLLAGVWGMNFEHMPELQWRYGYVLALSIIVAVCLTLYRAFKRNSWL